MNKRIQILKFIYDQGTVSTYPFVEMGDYPVLTALVNEGLVERVKVKGNLDECHITEAGIQVLSRQQPLAS